MRGVMRSGYWLCCFWLLLLGGSGQVWALDPEQPLGSMRIERWYSDEGLPHNTVHSVAQTRDGYLWLATWEGLARYNGRNFKRIDSSDLDARIDSGFRAVLATDTGDLWAASVRNGLFVLHAGSWRRLGSEDGLPSDNLYSLGAAAGGIWVGSRDAGAFFIPDQGAVQRYGVAEGLHSAWVHGFLQDPDGSVWIATASGLNRLDAGHVLDAGAGLPAGSAVYCLLRDRTGRLWVGTSQGLFYFSDGSLRLYPMQRPGPRSVSVLLEDRDGNLWAGSQSEGLWRIGGGNAERLTAAQGLSNNRVTGLLEDREGSLWVATNAGLNRVGDSAFRTYTRYDGLKDDFVRSISEGRSGIWIGTSQGLHLLSAEGLSAVNDAELSSASVMAVLESRDGRLWAGTYDGGLNLRTDGKWQVLGQAQGLPSNQVRALFEASDGGVWVGTTQGVLRMDQSPPKALTRADGLPSDYVMAIAQLGDGSMLFGTTQGFAQLGVDGVMQSHSARSGFPAAEVFAFLEDAAGVVWLGTDSGLLRWENGSFRRYGREQGLQDEAVFSVIDDRMGQLYLSTNAGLLAVGRSSLDGDGPLSVTQYTHDDGLAGTQINGSSQPSSWRSRNGHLWLPTARGVSELDVNRRADVGRGLVPVAVEAVRVDGELQSLDQPLRVAAGKRRVRLEFAGLSFIKASRLRYRHRLLGFENEWSAPLRDSTVEFTNLQPGNYRFEVQAGENEFEGSPIAVVAFEVLPTLWQSWWFMPLLAVLAMVGVIVLHQLRLRTLNARSRQLELLVEQRTVELSSRNDALTRLDKDKSALLNTIQLQAQAFARQAREDALTGLFNRRHFDQLFQREFARQRASGQEPIAALVDVDLFKSVNDQWSHQAGDDVLRSIAAVLERHMQGIGTAARYGGEEFALYFSAVDLDLARAQAVAEAIRAEIAALRFAGYPQLQATVSIGLACDPTCPNHEKLLAQADQQLYRAKSAGRNRIVV